MTPNPNPPKQGYYSPTGTDFARVFNFADGVFSIAVTLLAFDVKLPDTQVDGAHLAEAIAALGPKAFIYAMSFLVIGLFWMGHHRMFRLLKQFDSVLLWVNNLFLLLVAFLPVPSAILGRFPNEGVAVRLYFGCIVLCSTTMGFMWMYASKHRRLIGPDLPDAVIRVTTWRSVLTVAAATTCGIVASVQPRFALELMVGYTAAAFPVGWIYRSWLARREGVSV
jgi:uncharacterized membrane protein